MNFSKIISLEKSEDDCLWGPGDSADYFYFVLQGQILIHHDELFE
jgi:hypothetical protein